MAGVSYTTPPFLCHPLLLEKSKPKSAIASFQPNYILPILQNVLLENFDFNSLPQGITQEWFMQCTSFSLRIICSESSEARQLVDYSLNFYNLINFKAKRELDNDGKISENTHNLLFSSLLHVSQIFLNPIFSPQSMRFLKFQQNIRNCFISDTNNWPADIQRLLADVILCGTRDFAKTFDSKESNDYTAAKNMGTLALDILKKYPSKSSEDFEYFMPHFEVLFQFDFFVDLWIERFIKLYKSAIFRAPMSYDFLNFIIQKISTKFNKIDKNRAFAAFVDTWLVYDRKQSSAFVSPQWNNLQEMNDIFLKWFDVESEWVFEEHSYSKYSTHPLFVLAEKFKASDIDKTDINKVVEDYIVHILRLEKGKENLAFWLFPIHSKHYLMTWEQFPKYVDDFIKYMNHVYEAFAEHETRKNIVTLIDSKIINKKIDTLFSEIFVSMTTIISIIHRYSPNIDLTYLLDNTDSCSSPTFQFISLLVILFSKYKENFWKVAMQFVSMQETFPSIVTLIIGISFHIISPELFRPIKFDENPKIFFRGIIEILSENLFNNFPEELSRILFGFIAIAQSTPFFQENPNFLMKLLKWGDSCPTINYITNLFEMLKMTISFGGVSTDTEDKKPDLNISNCSETFVTQKYIISVFEDKLVIRHALGSIVYNIDKKYDPIKPKEIEIIEKQEETNKLQENSEQKNQTSTENSEEIQLAIDIDSFLTNDEPNQNAKEEDIEKLFPSYSYTAKKTDNMLAHSFLTDFDMLSFSGENTRLLGASSQMKIKELDQKSIKPIFPAFVVQVTNSPEPKFGKQNTAARTRLFDALSGSKKNEGFLNSIVYETNILKVSYAFDATLPSQPNEVKMSRSADSIRIQELPREAVAAPLIIVLNESGSPLIHSCASFSEFNSVVELVPQEDGFFNVSLTILPAVATFENLVVEEYHYTIKDEDLGKFIAIFAVIMFTSKSSITCGLQLAASYFERKKLIQKYFEGGSFGCSSILANVLTRGKPKPKT